MNGIGAKASSLVDPDLPGGELIQKGISDVEHDVLSVETLLGA